MTLTKVDWVSAGLTIATTAYTSGDVLGTESTVAVGLGSGLTGYIVAARLIDAGKVLGATDLFIFDAASTPAADNAANSWSDANMLNLVKIVQLTNAYTSANNNVVDTGATALKTPFTSRSGNLYITAVTRTANAIFTAVGDVTYRLWIESSGL